MNQVSAPFVLPSLVALMSYLAAAWRREGPMAWMPRLLLLGWVAHGIALTIDISGWGLESPGARFGFAPALSSTVWLVLAVYLLESRLAPIDPVRRTLALLGIVAVSLAVFFPGELRPYAGSQWAPLHWLLGFASYGLFGAAVLHAWLLDRADRRLRRPAAVTTARARAAASSGDGPSPTSTGLPLLALERLTFGFVAAGFVALTAAIVLGAAFTSPWRWDHKTVFSVLGWAVFAALLAGRHFAGWRGRVATRWVYTGAVLLLLGYVGSRFVIEVVLDRA